MQQSVQLHDSSPLVFLVQLRIHLSLCSLRRDITATVNIAAFDAESVSSADLGDGGLGEARCTGHPGTCNGFLRLGFQHVLSSSLGSGSCCAWAGGS